MALTTRDRRAIVFLAAFLVAGAAAFLLLTGGKGEIASATPRAAVVPQASPTSGSPFSQPSPTRSPSPSPAPQVLVLYGRDPFQPVGQVGSVVPQTSPSPSTSPAPTVSPAGTPPTSANDGSSTTIDGHAVLLDSLYTKNGQQRAQVEVDGTVYTVAEGDTFAGSFKLVSVSADTANFLYGDQTFSLTLSNQGGSK